MQVNGPEGLKLARQKSRVFQLSVRYLCKKKNVQQESVRQGIISTPLNSLNQKQSTAPSMLRDAAREKVVNIRTYCQALPRETLWQLWVLGRRDLDFCVRSTPLHFFQVPPENILVL